VTTTLLVQVGDATTPATAADANGYAQPYHADGTLASGAGIAALRSQAKLSANVSYLCVQFDVSGLQKVRVALGNSNATTRALRGAKMSYFLST
jgi:hypothetical protein